MATAYHGSSTEILTALGPSAAHYSVSAKSMSTYMYHPGVLGAMTSNSPVLRNLEFTAPLPKTPAPPLSPPPPLSHGKRVMNRSNTSMIARSRVGGNAAYPRAPSSPSLGSKPGMYESSSLRHVHSMPSSCNSPIHSPPPPSGHHSHSLHSSPPSTASSSPNSYGQSMCGTPTIYNPFLISKRQEFAVNNFPEVLLVSPGEPTPIQLSSYDNKQPTGFLHVTNGNQTVEFLVGVANMPLKA